MFAFFFGVCGQQYACPHTQSAASSPGQEQNGGRKRRARRGACGIGWLPFPFVVEWNEQFYSGFGERRAWQSMCWFCACLICSWVSASVGGSRCPATDEDLSYVAVILTAV